MFTLVITFIKSPEEVTKHADGHFAWAKKYADQGVFLIAGPKKSRLGGSIIVKSIERSQLKKIIAEDPYFQLELVEYQIIDFDCVYTAPELDFIKNA
jgi:uncharacterized protein YciI